MCDLAALLALVAQASTPRTRAFHPAGLADPDGFLAMGCDEILVHGYDLSLGLDIEYMPPADLVARVRSRLFPWAPTAGDPWRVLLWANGRLELADHGRLDASWWWHCAPLEEWDGETHRRTELDPPGWK